MPDDLEVDRLADGVSDGLDVDIQKTTLITPAR
jgi:hypothetical protein